VIRNESAACHDDRTELDPSREPAEQAEGPLRQPARLLGKLSEGRERRAG